MPEGTSFSSAGVITLSKRKLRKWATKNDLTTFHHTQISSSQQR